MLTVSGTILSGEPSPVKISNLTAPQCTKVPSEQSATLWEVPAAKATTVLPASTPLVLTATGTRSPTVPSLPNWPTWLKPQPTTVPSEQSAKLNSRPAAMAVTVLPASAPLVLTAT